MIGCPLRILGLFVVDISKVLFILFIVVDKIFFSVLYDFSDNRLELPFYKSKNQLKEKLQKAVTETEGFFVV